MLQKIFIVILALVLQHCPGSKKPGDVINVYIKKTYDQSQIIPVYVATNRKGNTSTCSDESFLNNPGQSLRYFICPVSVPKNHSIGSLDTDENSKNLSNKYFKIGNIQNTNKTDFYSSLSKDNEVLVFVHGFNVKFEEALLRASQIVYDVKFQGSIILYTWPAGSDSGFLNQLLMNRTYSFNRTNATKSVPFFQKFLSKLATENKQIQVVVHSMGHQVVLPALIDLQKSGSKKILDQLVLNAPDFPTREFLKSSSQIREMANRITMYCSPGDNALLASVQFNNNHRIGLCAKIQGIDVINVNDIDSPVLGIGGLGHGYYSGRAIITDLFQILLGVDVDKRLFIRKGSKKGYEHYFLRK